MDERVEVEPEQILSANAPILEWLARRLYKKGRKGYIGPHETLGVIEEEYDELKEAVRSDDLEQVIRELTDVAVGCLFGIASLRQNEIAMRKKRAEKANKRFGITK